MKSKNKKLATPYARAQRKWKDIKDFYGHLTAYIIVNLFLLLSRSNFRIMDGRKSSLQDVDFVNWIDWNVYGTPIIWGIFLAFHAFSVFGKNPFLGKAWEERQIEKFINRDNKEL